VFCIPDIRCREIFRRFRGCDILRETPGPGMQQTIQNKDDENTCNLQRAQELKKLKS